MALGTRNRRRDPEFGTSAPTTGRTDAGPSSNGRPSPEPMAALRPRFSGRRTAP